MTRTVIGINRGNNRAAKAWIVSVHMQARILGRLELSRLGLIGASTRGANK